MNHSARSKSLLVGTFFLLLGLSGPVSATGLTTESATSELIVKYREPVAGQNGRSGRPLQGLGMVRAGFNDRGWRYEVIKVDPAADPAALEAALEADPAVDYVEVNFRARALATPNDPLLKRQWNFSQIRAESAWRLTDRPGNGVVVAVLDTGVAYENRTAGGVSYRRIPDFSGTAFVPGYDFVNGDSHPNDDQGHGTHVAGVIAQTSNNGYGTAGLAPAAKIMPVKVLDQYGFGTAFDIARAIRWAADNGAKVINLSLGLDGVSQTVEDALEYARNEKNCTIVAAAGNGALDSGYSGGLMYPASSSMVISVGATGYDKQRAAYSQYGSGLDLVAPGGTGRDQNRDGFIDGILQETITDGDPSTYGFYWITGTSQAAPHVSAAVAILIARGLNTPDEIYRALTRSAEDRGAVGRDKYYGYGLLDLYGAMTFKRTSTKWYFAEGYTAGRFSTKILIANPANVQAKVRAYFSKPGGIRITRDYTIGAGRPYTINVDSIPGLGSTGVSTKLESTNGVGIVAERTMFFNYEGRNGTHSTKGATSPAKKWYLAEGYTRGAFETHILIYNPNPARSKVKASFTKTDGDRIARSYTIPAYGRRKIVVDKIASMGAVEFATEVEVVSGPAIVVERSMYFGYGDKHGGHSTIGATAPQTKWLFAEGTTRGNFETWILVQNPSRRNAVIKATFVRPDGVAVVRNYKLHPGRRRTISVNSLPGLKDSDVAAKIESTNGIGVVAERAMYFDQGGHQGGHVTLGAPGPAQTWYFAHGFTGAGFETWILIYNPRASAAKVSAQFMREDGLRATRKITVSPRSRRTILVDSVPALESARVAIKVFSTNGVPVVAEKAVYFNRNGWSGGHATAGYAP